MSSDDILNYISKSISQSHYDTSIQPNEMFSNDLFHAIERYDWAAARALLETSNARDLVDCTNARKRNALHYACCFEVPLDIVQSMLVAAKEAPLQKDVIGNTPLHDAIRYSSEEIIFVLLEACPRAASISDDNGWPPLHRAMDYNKSSNIIRHILAVHPKAATATDEGGGTPLNLLFRQWNMPLRNLLDSIGADENAIDDVILRDEFGCEKRVRELHETILLILRAATHETIKEKHETLFRPLHAAIINQHCPWSFVNLILRMDPKQASYQDEEGSLSLHIAAAATSSFDEECVECTCKIQNSLWHHCESIFDIYCQNCFKELDFDLLGTKKEEYNLMNSVDKIPAVIRDLLATNSTLSQNPDREGRLPLHIATENRNLSDGVVEAIFQDAPEALSTTDVKTKLYPFMIAAVEHKLDLCYTLLTKNPTLVSSGISKQRKRKRDQL